MNYSEFRRSLFDPKGDLPLEAPPIVSNEQLVKAASVVGPISELKFVPGTLNRCWEFDGPDGSYVLRLPLPKLAESLVIEDWAAQAAVEARFPTITPIVTDTSHYLVPFSYQVLPFVPESPSSDLPLHRLQSIHLDGYGPLDSRGVSRGRKPRGLHDSWESYLLTKLDDHLDICIEIGAMTVPEAERADDIIRNLHVTFDTCLIHNDLSPKNVRSSIIDWESCIAGDPIWEQAGRAAFFANTPIKGDYRFWVYYLRIVIARTVHRYRFNIPENPLYPKASSRIQMAFKNLNT